MSLWYTTRSRDPNPTGKFLHRRRTGTEHDRGQPYRGWSHQLIHYNTASTVNRKLFNVSIFDSHGQPANYLQGYATAAQANQAARQWIDETLARR